MEFLEKNKMRLYEDLKKPGHPFVKEKEYQIKPLTIKELRKLIRKKFGTGYDGIKHLFRLNDPTGRGAVSRMGWNGKTPIHFDTFMEFFKECEDETDWVSPLKTPKSYQETYFRRGDMKTYDPYTSMPFSHAIFKEKCKSKDFDARKVFPPSVFEPDGIILPPQLREAYGALGILMTDDDFNNLWQRYDKEGTKALRSENFFRACGLDFQGRPRHAASFTPRGAAYSATRQRSHSEIGHTDDGHDARTKLKNILKREGIEATVVCNNKSENKDKSKIDIPTGKDEKTEKNTVLDKEIERKIDNKRQPKATPKLDNILDCLHYKFEESYQAMLTAFRLFDFMNNSYVSKVDFRRVLSEFRFSISPLDLDNFLKRNGLHLVKGQINYNIFLINVQSKSLSSVFDKIAVDQTGECNNETPRSMPCLTANAIETRLIYHFHGDFIKLLMYFRRCDKDNTGSITCYEFRIGIEKILGYGMTESQWDQLKTDIGQYNGILIDYIQFLELFDGTPGSWNMKQEGGIKVAQLCRVDIPTPIQTDRLKESVKAENEQNKCAENLNNVEKIKTKLDELFKNRFHAFDKHFKAMDRRMTGRMSKWQFGALLKMCELSLHPKELDKIWTTLNVSSDNMFSYSALIRQFAGYNLHHEEKDKLVSECTTEVEAAKRNPTDRHVELSKKDQMARTKMHEQTENCMQEKSHLTQQSPRAASVASHMSHALIPSHPASRTSFTSVQSIHTMSLLVKIRTNVINNWDGLKSVFKYIDRHGTTYIAATDMKKIMTSLQFSLNDGEKSELCERFDTQRNGRFNYLQFMKCFAQKTKKQEQVQPPLQSNASHQHPPEVQNKVSHQHHPPEHRNFTNQYRSPEHSTVSNQHNPLEQSNVNHQYHTTKHTKVSHHQHPPDHIKVSHQHHPTDQNNVHNHHYALEDNKVNHQHKPPEHSNVSYQLKTQILKEYDNLCQTYQKLDQTKKRYITMQDL